MTEQKPYGYAFFSLWSGNNAFSFTPPDPSAGREVRPLYEHPAPAQPATDPAVEAALKEATALAMVLWRKHFAEAAPNWKPLPDLPGVLSQIDNMTAGLSRTPEQPATDPAVEAARRKALRAVFRALDATAGYSDLYSVRLAAGVLRDLVGQRPDDTRVSICGYDEEPDLKVSAAMHETRVNTADLAQKEAIDFIAEGLEAAHAARTHTDAMWWLMTDGGKEKWRAEARVLAARAAKAI